jgi:hypothetical protein
MGTNVLKIQGEWVAQIFNKIIHWVQTFWTKFQATRLFWVLLLLYFTCTGFFNSPMGSMLYPIPSTDSPSPPPQDQLSRTVADNFSTPNFYSLSLLFVCFCFFLSLTFSLCFFICLFSVCLTLETGIHT